jgi:RNA polymerase sigma-70 factor (ECF subfamily)
MSAEEDDGALAARIAQGDDRQAETELCRRWFPRVRAYGRLHVGANDAADLAQEVLAVLIRALREGRVEDASRLGAYVSGVSRNIASGWKKGERRRGSLLERFGPAWLETTAPPPMLEQSRLVDCLRKLSARERAVVVLTFYADQDGEEIGRELDMSAGNVRVARHRALKQLLSCVGGES